MIHKQYKKLIELGMPEIELISPNEYGWVIFGSVGMAMFELDSKKIEGMLEKHVRQWFHDNYTAWRTALAVYYAEEDNKVSIRWNDEDGLTEASNFLEAVIEAVKQIKGLE